MTTTTHKPLVVPTHFKSVVLADGENATLGVRFKHVDLPLADAARLLCGAQLRVGMTIGDPSQARFEDMDEKLEGICEVKGFSVTPKAINATLRFSREEIGAEDLARFANQDGQIEAERVGKAGKAGRQGGDDEGEGLETDESTPLLDEVDGESDQDDSSFGEEDDLTLEEIGMAPKLIPVLEAGGISTLGDLKECLAARGTFTEIEGIDQFDDEEICLLVKAIAGEDAGQAKADEGDVENDGDEDPEWRDVTIKHVLERRGATMTGLKALHDEDIHTLGDLDHALEFSEHSGLEGFLAAIEGISSKTAGKIAEAITHWTAYPHKKPSPSWCSQEGEVEDTIPFTNAG